MSRIRTLAGGIAAGIALSSTAAAAPLSWFDSQATLTAWYANQLNSAGNIYAPPAASTITNLPAHWYAPATVTPAAPPVAIAPAPTVAPAPVVVPTPAPPPPADRPATVLASSIMPASGSGASVLNYSRGPAFGNSTTTADAFINLGGQPYAESSDLTVGDPQPWYHSPAAIAAFGGAPSASQQSNFSQDVLSKVERTFELSGVDVNLTTDPNVPASRMMSVVSGASYGGNPDAIGITRVGDDGFSFIDKLNYATTPDQLSWAVAHNVAHELMHAFGVADHPDQTGDYVDAAVADWKMLTDPDAKFSPSAVSYLETLSRSVSSSTVGAEILKSGVLSAQCVCGVCAAAQGLSLDGDQVLGAPVPEPSTVAVWAFASIGGGLFLRRRAARQAR